MAEQLELPKNARKEETYKIIIPQIKVVISESYDLIANLANVTAILKQAFEFHWVGFYRVIEPQTLILGPFQGLLACVRIPFGSGVCGQAASNQKTILVPDVNQFPGHIACSSLSKSEIVVPLVYKGETKLVLDIDSDKLDAFNAIDQNYLEQIIKIICVRNFLNKNL
ncbi:GAF domain-containing protein [Liberibacter crescens BT-1]|uniref:GAF domain-containing protein n=1 Tax=Liberibacter crescens (strain BT-1) TaxID=1215343 RepID=L0EWN6_LIBCB|nr:GAF domain-containing protein [Liberibacter crescens]AGA65043.1 GAF domain-containing protein [Liberibacter crescens BT-1]AMC13043.1 GAF domain-containing protein [Liberibacter crescens]